MRQYQGLCKCGETHNTFVFNWLMLIIGMVIGAMLFGVPMGRSMAIESIKDMAPNYSTETGNAIRGLNNEILGISNKTKARGGQ